MRVSRKKYVIKKKIMQYDEFMDRIKKSFYYGNNGIKGNVELTSPLAEYASEYFSEPQKGNSLQKLTKFTAGSVRLPNPCSLIMALIYLDRLNETNPGYVKNGITPSDLFLVSVVVSSKFCYDVDEDSTFYLDDFLQDCDISMEHYKKLEIEFLCAIDWKIYISNETFEEKLKLIEKFLAKREGLKRGWLTYSELIHFLPSFTLAKFLLNNITVMAVSYVASVMTMAGAFFLVSNIPGNGLLQNNRIEINNKTETTSQHFEILNNNNNTSNDNNIAGNDSNLEKSTLNIENELEKVQKQYESEEILQINIRNYNQYSVPLIHFYENYIRNKLSCLLYQGINFIKVKIIKNSLTSDHQYGCELYDDDEIISNKSKFLIQENGNYYETSIKFNIKNFTKTLFWDLMYDSEKSFKKPFIWFKFI